MAGPTPSLGRPVHYVDHEGTEHAALIIGTGERGESLVVFKQFVTFYPTDIPFATNGQFMSWHLPEAVQ